MKYDRFDYDIGALDSHWTDYQMVQMVGHGKKVLEVGCATGYIGKYLKERQGCELFGIELDEESAAAARAYYEKMVVGDVSDGKTLRELGSERFDVILLSNVLEHTRYPETVLKSMNSLLKSGGYFVIALPNIAHWSVRLSLLFGKFDYCEKGIMDESHLRFFTLKTARELLESSGLEIAEWGFDWDNGIPFLNGLLRRVPIVGQKILGALYSLNPALFGYQFIFKASVR